MAAVAAQVDEELLAPRRDVAAVEPLDRRMALDAVRLHLLLAEERVLLAQRHVLENARLVVEIGVRLLGAVDGRSLAVVAGRAAVLLGRMLRQVELPLGVRLPRVRLILESGLVDAGMARGAAIHPGHGLEVVVAIVLLEHHLLDLRDLRLPVETEEGELFLGTGQVAERHVLELPLQVVALLRELRELVLGGQELVLLPLDLVLDGLDPLLRRLEDALPLYPFLLAVLDLLRPAVDLRLIVVMQRLVVVVAPFLELALDEPEVQVLLEVLVLQRRELRLERGNLVRDVSRGDARLRVGHPLRGRLIGRVGVQARLLVGDLLLDGRDLEASEVPLILLPGPAEDVVVEHRPEPGHHEQEREDQPGRDVRALLVIERTVASCHESAHALRSRSRPTMKNPIPVSDKYSSFHMSSSAMPR